MSNYQQLSEAELRTYVKTHPDDEEAFQHYLTNMRAKPNRVVVSTEEQALIEFRKRIQAESTP
ncbi:DUF6887 family protein [aff. Roholtiella sp. LEGE 12411]|uniref:DUF6887 family protein n=1 Tax=aff. Roholtiella sp. LEGE 12411 TaxID=1828822 RepID=UPI001880B1A2|nr:hypothetical protein [aff. Roholtiella sp. LEGE 12411]MBE9036619.1 hypothetical protein [aff. Roholtiella sp. LEGE 12411]